MTKQIQKLNSNYDSTSIMTYAYTSGGYIHTVDFNKIHDILHLD